MNKNHIIGGTAALIGFVVTTYVLGSREATINRPVFDGLDKRTLRKVHNQMLRDAVVGKLDAGSMTEEQLDAHALAKYKAWQYVNQSR